MHRNRGARLEAVMEVVALHHAGHGVAAGQLDHAARTQRVAPLAVVADLGFGRVQYQAGLTVVGLGVHLDLLGGERRARTVAAGRVANHAGEVTDQKDHRVAQILQLAHLVEHHGVADVDVRRCRVQPQLDAQRFAGGFRLGELFHPFVLREQFFHTAQGDRKGLAHTIAYN